MNLQLCEVIFLYIEIDKEINELICRAIDQQS